MALRERLRDWGFEGEVGFEGWGDVPRSASSLLIALVDEKELRELLRDRVLFEEAQVLSRGAISLWWCCVVFLVVDE